MQPVFPWFTTRKLLIHFIDKSCEYKKIQNLTKNWLCINMYFECIVCCYKAEIVIISINNSIFLLYNEIFNLSLLYNWRHPSLCEITPIIWNMELTNLGSEHLSIVLNKLFRNDTWQILIIKWIMDFDFRRVFLAISISLRLRIFWNFLFIIYSYLEN